MSSAVNYKKKKKNAKFSRLSTVSVLRIHSHFNTKFTNFLV